MMQIYKKKTWHHCPAFFLYFMQAIADKPLNISSLQNKDMFRTRQGAEGTQNKTVLKPCLSRVCTHGVMCLIKKGQIGVWRNEQFWNKLTKLG